MSEKKNKKEKSIYMELLSKYHLPALEVPESLLKYQKKQFLKDVKAFKKKSQDEADGSFDVFTFQALDHTIDAETLRAKGELVKMYQQAVSDAEDIQIAMKSEMNDIEACIKRLESQLAIKQEKIKEYETVRKKEKLSDRLKRRNSRPHKNK